MRRSLASYLLSVKHVFYEMWCLNSIVLAIVQYIVCEFTVLCEDDVTVSLARWSVAGSREKVFFGGKGCDWL